MVCCLQKPKKAGAVVPVQTIGLRTRRLDVTRQEKMNVPAQAQRANLPFLCLSDLFKRVGSALSYW